MSCEQPQVGANDKLKFVGPRTVGLGEFCSPQLEVRNLEIDEVILAGKPFPKMLLIAHHPSRAARLGTLAGLILLIPLVLLANEESLAGQASRQDDQKYAGTWAGSYSADNEATESLSYILRKDEKGQWGGTVKYSNQDGEQAAEFKSLEIDE